MKFQVRSLDRRSGIFDAKKDYFVPARLEFTRQSNHGIEVTAVRHANKTDLHSPAFCELTLHRKGYFGAYSAIAAEPRLCSNCRDRCLEERLYRSASCRLGDV